MLSNAKQCYTMICNSLQCLIELLKWPIGLKDRRGKPVPRAAAAYGWQLKITALCKRTGFYHLNWAISHLGLKLYWPLYFSVQMLYRTCANKGRSWIIATQSEVAQNRCILINFVQKCVLWCSYYASMLAEQFFVFFPACSLLLQPARKENSWLFSNLLAYYNLLA